MNAQEATTPEELVAILAKSNEVLEFVPRKLLIKTLGEENAQRFLPALPDFVSINVDNFLMVVKLVKPKLLEPPTPTDPS